MTPSLYQELLYPFVSYYLLAGVSPAFMYIAPPFLFAGASSGLLLVCESC